MFSSRLDWDLRPNRISILLKEKRRSGAAILDLTESNPTRVGLSYAAEKILRVFADERSLNYEPTPTGLLSARESVSGYYASRGWPVDPERILLTASTSEAYSYLFKLLADPGDEVLVPRPSYPLFGYLAALDSVRVVPYRLAYHAGWAIDFDSLTSSVTPRTRAVVVVNPNNPTGSFLKRDELEKLLALCAERDLAIICDEVFADYSFEPTPPSQNRVMTLANVHEVLTFCLSGLSKIAGLPQMKLGWIVLGGPAAILAEARERLELIADTYLSVGAPVQHALPQLLALAPSLQEQIQSRLQKNLAFLQSAIGSDSACNILESEGGWYAILQVPRTRTEEEWCLELLDRDNVVVQPGFFYDFESEAFLVVSLLPSPEIFREAASRLLARVTAS